MKKIILFAFVFICGCTSDSNRAHRGGGNGGGAKPSDHVDALSTCDELSSQLVRVGEISRDELFAMSVDSLAQKPDLPLEQISHCADEKIFIRCDAKKCFIQEK